LEVGILRIFLSFFQIFFDNFWEICRITLQNWKLNDCLRKTNFIDFLKNETSTISEFFKKPTASYSYSSTILVDLQDPTMFVVNKKSVLIHTKRSFGFRSPISIFAQWTADFIFLYIYFIYFRSIAGSYDLWHSRSTQMSHSRRK
jgi:hypothetical protein